MRLEAALGTGEDWGKLRLAAAGLRAFELKPAGKSRDILKIHVPLPDGASRELRDREPVEVRVAVPDIVILTLPLWARPKLPGRGAAAPAMVSVTGQMLGDPPASRKRT